MTTCACGCGEMPNLAPHSDRKKGWVKCRPLKWRKSHHERGEGGFLAFEITENGCWEFRRGMGAGYGSLVIAGQKRLAHRYVYETFVEPIPEGLQIDHLCRNRACINPDHLEPVTQSVNLRRGRSVEREKTHCAQGHPFDEANTRWTREGYRLCIACIRTRNRRQYLRRKAA